VLRGRRLNASKVRYSFRDWSLPRVERNGITVPPVRGGLLKALSDDLTAVETLTWQANGKPFCCLYIVRGGGHVIPQPAYRSPRLLGKTTTVLDAPREAIRFFENDNLLSGVLLS
jgi:hypothetical protein